MTDSSVARSPQASRSPLDHDHNDGERPERRPARSARGGSGAAAHLSFDTATSSSTTAAVSPSRADDDDVTLSAMSRITTRTTPLRDHDSSRSSLYGTSGLVSPDSTDARAPRQYRNEAIRLRTLLNTCRDELQEARRECGGLHKANEVRERELAETHAGWVAAKQALESQRRELTQQRLAATALQGERDELEEKVREAWQRVAELGKELRESEDARRALQHQLEVNQGRPSPAPRPAAMAVQRHARVEHQALAEAVRVLERLVGDVDRHLRDGCAASEVNRPTSSSDPATCVAVTHAAEFAVDVLKDADVRIEAAVRQAVNAANTLDSTNDDDDAPPRHSADAVVATTRTVLAPLTHTLRSWAHVVQRLCDDRARLIEKSTSARRAVDALEQEKTAWEQERAWWRRHDEQQQQQLDAERAVGEAPAARRALAEQLACLEDWSLIAHATASLQQRLADTEAALAQTEAEKRAAQAEAETLRHRQSEPPQTKPPRHTVTPSSSTSSSTHEVVSASAEREGATVQSNELTQLQAQYEEALQYVRDELEPLTAAQAAELRARRGEVDTLRAEKEALDATVRHANDARDAAVEALVVLARAYTGQAKESRELVQQRRALTYHSLVDRAHSARGAPQAGLRRWRVAVVAVLAVQRLARLMAPSSRESWWPQQRMVLPEFPHFTHRLRLPAESRVRLIAGGTSESTDSASETASLPTEVVHSIIARWQRQSPSPDSSDNGEDVRTPWLVRAMVEAVLLGGSRRATSTASPRTLAEALQRGLQRLSAASIVHSNAPVAQSPLFYSPDNWFTPRQPPQPQKQQVSGRGEESRGGPVHASAVPSAPPSRHLNRAESTADHDGAVSGPAGLHDGTQRSTPSARKQLFASSAGLHTGGADANVPAHQVWPESITYPPPQLPRARRDEPSSGDKQATHVSATERELLASIARDRVETSYDLSTGGSTGGPRAPSMYSVPGNGFAHEVLGVIDALDRRVTGALQRSART